MGNWIGHILPGSLFIIFAILWSINLLRFYFRKKLKHGSTEDMQFEFKKFHRPIESLALLFILPIAMLGEYFTAWESPPLMTPDNLQHISMYLFFFISSIANMLEFYSISPLPSTLIEPLYGFAFGAETLLLYFHTHGQGPVEQHLHKLLTFAAFMCTISSFLSGFARNDVVVQLAKPLFALLQGSWFCQIGFMLYPIFEMHPNRHQPQPEHHSSALTANGTHQHDHQHDHMSEHGQAHAFNAHRDIMITTAYFCWHFAMCIVTLFVLAIICRKKYYKPTEVLSSKYQRLLEETSVNEDHLKPVI